mgnify:FL=1
MRDIDYIDILLPYKEIFEFKKASAVSLTIYNSLKFSKYKKKIRVFGKTINKPLTKNYISLKTNRLIDFGNNISIAKRYIKYLNKKKNTLIEIHNRPKLFNYIINKSSNPVSIHFHNDPLKMSGSKKLSEREFIAQNASAVYFVSDFIKKKFTKNFKKKYSNLHILFNGINRTLKKKPIKRKNILFVGRLVSAKGILIYLKALEKLLPICPDWNFYVVGTVKPGYNLDKLPFYLKSRTDRDGQKIMDSIRNLSKSKKNFHYLSFIDNQKVQKLMRDSSILVVPSIWDDPCPLTPIEGLANGTVVVSTNRGGIPEILKKKGIIIKNINSDKLFNELNNLILNKNYLNKYLNLSWKNFKLNINKLVINQDLIRSNIIKKFKF